MRRAPLSRQSVSLYQRLSADLSFVVDQQVTEGDFVSSRWTLHGTNRGRPCRGLGRDRQSGAGSPARGLALSTHARDRVASAPRTGARLPRVPQGLGRSSIAETIDRHRRPDDLHDPERPRPHQETVRGGEQAATCESQDVARVAMLQCVHRHHESQGQNAEGSQHGFKSDEGRRAIRLAALSLFEPSAPDHETRCQ